MGVLVTRRHVRAGRDEQQTDGGAETVGKRTNERGKEIVDVGRRRRNNIWLACKFSFERKQAARDEAEKLVGKDENKCVYRDR